MRANSVDANPEQEMTLGNSGLVKVKTAAGALAAAQRERDKALPPKAVKESTLATYVRDIYVENRDYRISSGVEERLLDNLRRRLGEYAPEKLQKIAAQGGSDIFAEITGVKCRNAESWLSDVFSPDDEKAWSLQPTPLPELPAEAVAEVEKLAAQFAQQRAMEAVQAGQPVTPEQASQLAANAKPVIEKFLKDKLRKKTEQRVKRMERTMYDQLLETGWDDTMDQFLFDITTFPTAVLKGPIIQMRKTRRWEIQANGASTLVVERTPVPVFSRVSPFDCYPSPLSEGAEGPGAFIERLHLTRDSLEDMKDYDGYDAAAIDRILAATDGKPTHPETTEPIDVDRKGLESSPQGTAEDAPRGADEIVGLELHGFVSGKLLREHNLKDDNDGKPIRDTHQYAAEVVTIGTELIYVSLNADKLDRHPYSATSWTKIAGSFWGESIPQLLAPVQDVCNAALRALVNNMGFSSGPQVAVTDIDRVPLNEDLTDVYPFKLWQFTNENRMTSDPIKFFAIPSNANELYVIYENFKKQADDDSGVPAYAYGNERAAGAGRTASGLSMLMTGASRGIKKVIRNAHRDVVRQCLIRLYDWNMQNIDDPEIKGDADIVAIGAVAVLSREQASTRRLELLNMSNNPTDLAIFGRKNRAELWRQTLDTLEFDGDRYILTDDEIDELEKRETQQLRAAQQAEQAVAEAEASKAQQEVQIKKQIADQTYELERLRIELKAGETSGKSAVEQERIRTDRMKLDQDQEQYDIEAVRNSALEALQNGESQDIGTGAGGGSRPPAQP